jgi:hypothetical protein
MGLTIHYELIAKTDSQARRFLRALHTAALDLPFHQVGEIKTFEGEAANFENCDKENPDRWFLIQADGDVALGKGKGGFESWKSVSPESVIGFSTWPGHGCEEANFGFSKFPGFIEYDGRRIRTKLGGWRWSSFCKTQYTSDPSVGGLPHFLRCHLAVVALLDRAKELGCLQRVKDEGGFWEKRSVEALSKEIGQWNQMIAAVGGVLQGIAEKDGSKLEAPIFGFPNFERLEAAGHENLPEILKSLSQIEPKDLR